MLPLLTIRRVCAAIDVVFLTIIASSLSKVRARSDFAAGRSSFHISESFPAISACADAIEKDSLPTRRKRRTRGYQETPASPSPSATEVICEPALIRIKKERDPEKLFSLFQSNANNRLVVENRFAFEDAVSRLAGARRLDLIERLLEYQKSLLQGRREGFVVRIITLYGRAKMADHALKTFDEMHLFGCPRTAKSFNATLQVLSRSFRFDDVRMLFDQASRKYGIEMDDISYNTVIKAFCEMGRLDTAYLIMIEMEKAGLKPDVVTYTTLMSASYKCYRCEIGNGLWNLMVIRRCLPNLATFNARIQHLINKGRGWQANHLTHKMVRSGLKPDELTYNLLIKGFCMMGELEMAKRTFFAMPSRGCKPNSKVYQTMVHYLCKAGMFDLAFSLCEDSMKMNWYPSIETLSSLVEGLVSASKESKARNIMEFVRKRVPSYSCGELNAFEAILSHSGKI